MGRKKRGKRKHREDATRSTGGTTADATASISPMRTDAARSDCATPTAAAISADVPVLATPDFMQTATEPEEPAPSGAVRRGTTPFLEPAGDSPKQREPRPRSIAPVAVVATPAPLPSSDPPYGQPKMNAPSPSQQPVTRLVSRSPQPVLAPSVAGATSVQPVEQGTVAESPGLATFSKSYTLFGLTTGARSDTAYDTEMPTRLIGNGPGTPGGHNWRIRRTGPPSPDVADGIRQRLRLALAWCAWLWAHAYAAWIAWRAWVQHEPVFPVADGSCNQILLLAAVLCSVSLLTGGTLLRDSRAWASAKDGLEAAADFSAAAMQALAFLKPLFWTLCFCSLAALATMRSSAALEGPICVVGQVTLVAVCYVYSRHPTRIAWGTVLSALLVHHLLALLVVSQGVGHSSLACLAHLAARVTSFSNEGGRQVLGCLVTGEFEETSFFAAPALAFTVLPNVLFLGFLANLLIHYGVAQRAIVKVGWLAHHVLGVTCCEAIVALANVFIGMCEAPLLVRPYVERLTRSELHCVMTVGFSTVSAAVLPTYTGLGLNSMDLIVASLLSTVAGIASSKLLYPETKLSITTYYNIDEFESPDRSAVEAVVGGMATVAAMAPSIACSLFTFLSAEACVHDLCSRLGKLVNMPEVTPHSMLTMVFEPLVALMGVELYEVNCAAKLLATRVLANDVVAYRDLVRGPSSSSLSVRTRRLLTFALCSFANVGSTAVTMGGLSAIAPSRSADVASLIFWALAAGCVANLLTACTVGTIVTNKVNPLAAKFKALDFLDG